MLIKWEYFRIAVKVLFIGLMLFAGGCSFLNDLFIEPEKITVFGTLTPLAGRSPSDYYIVSSCAQTTVSADGGFSIEIPNHGVSVVAAFPTYTSQTSAATEQAQEAGQNILFAIAVGQQGNRRVQVNALSTAAGLVFLFPGIATTNPSVAATILSEIASNSAVQALAQLIENTYPANPYPLDDPKFIGALEEAISSVLATLPENILVPTVSSIPSETPLHVLYLPIQEVAPKNERTGITKYPLDLEWIGLDISERGDYYSIKVSPSFLVECDWIADFAEVDLEQLHRLGGNNYLNSVTRTTPLPLRWDGLRKEVYVPSQGIAKTLAALFDIGKIIGQFVAGTFVPNEVRIPRSTPGVYLIRTYSGGGFEKDKEERNWLSSKPDVFVDGDHFDYMALLSNFAMGVLDIISIFLDFNTLFPKQKEKDEFVKLVIKQIDNKLLKNYVFLTFNSLIGFFAKAIEISFWSLIDYLKAKLSWYEAIITIGKISLKLTNILNILEMLKEVATAGSVLHRFFSLVWQVSPVESCIITVGEPFPEMPDLIVDRIFVTPSQFLPGQRVQICWSVKNIGDADARSFKVHAYLDANLVGKTDVDGLKKGENFSGCLNDFIWPADDKCHTVKVIVDADNAVSESNEGNNEQSQLFCSVCVNDTVPPDLTLYCGKPSSGNISFSWSATDNCSAGNEIQYQYWLEGFENAWSPWSTVTSKSYTGLPDGFYTFYVRAKDLKGNISAKSCSFRISSGCPDLAMQRIWTEPESFAPGQRITLWLEAKNIGTSDAGPFRISLLLDGHEIDAATANGLAVGRVLRGYKDDFVWPDSGCHVIAVVLDSTNAVSECREDNNTLAKQFCPSAPPQLPDLIVRNIELRMKNPPPPWTTFDVVVEVQNVGRGSAQGPFKVVLYQWDCPVTGDSSLLGSVTIPSLGPGETYKWTWCCIGMPDPPPVDWCVILEATVDPDNVVRESNETNNTLVKQF